MILQCKCDRIISPNGVWEGKVIPTEKPCYMCEYQREGRERRGVLN